MGSERVEREKGETLEREEFRDLGVRDNAELSRIKAEVSLLSLYNEDMVSTGP